MILTMLKAKIHRAVVTEADLNYVGSITIDKDLMEATGILEYEQVTIVDINNGNRLQTYVIEGKKGSGIICLNGAAARLVQTGDKVIIMAYCQIDSNLINEYKPNIIFVDNQNRIVGSKNIEEHGQK